MAAECPYDLAPLQGLLCATQRDFVAIVRAACLAWLKQHPSTTLEQASRSFVSRKALVRLPPKRQFVGRWSSDENSRFKNSFSRNPYRSGPAMMIA